MGGSCVIERDKKGVLEVCASSFPMEPPKKVLLQTVLSSRLTVGADIEPPGDDSALEPKTSKKSSLVSFFTNNIRVLYLEMEYLSGYL